jgi:hypothetical protein
VQAIAAFLRVLNALENIPSAVSIVRRSREASATEDLREQASLARGETRDALRVLQEGAMARVEEDGISRARTALSAAAAQFDLASRVPVRAAMEAALESLRRARSSLASVDTLPASFQK